MARDIERDEELMAATRERFLALLDLSAAKDDWEANANRLRSLMDEFVRRGHRLRAKQDRFNLMAPGPATQRPGIWVEEKQRQLSEAMRERGAPEWAVERSCA